MSIEYTSYGASTYGSQATASANGNIVINWAATTGSADIDWHRVAQEISEGFRRRRDMYEHDRPEERMPTDEEFESPEYVPQEGDLEEIEW